MPSWKRTLYAAWIAQICSITGFSFVLPFLPLYIRDLGVAESLVPRWAGIVGAAAAVPLVIFSPLWGALADRFGRKPMVLRSMVGGALVLLLMSYIQTVGQLMACRVVQGILTGTITASVALVASVTPRERSGYALGMMQAAVFIGASLGPFLGGELAQRFGPRAAFRVSAGLLLLAGVLAKFAIEERFTPSPRRAGRRWAGFAEVVGAAGFLAAVFALFALHFGNTVPAPVFPLFVEAVQGSSEGIYALTGRIAAVGGLAAAFSASRLGRMSDTWGHKRLLVASCIVAGAIALAYPLASRVWHLYVLRICFGLAAAGMVPSANAIIRKVTRDANLGKAYGVTNAVSSLGWAGGPLAGGFLYDLVRNPLGQAAGLRAPFLLMGTVLGLTALLVAWKVQTTSGAEPTQPVESVE